VVVYVVGGDVEGELEFAVTFEPRALFVAGQGFLGIARGRFGCMAADFGFEALAGAGDEDLVVARLVFFA
jgi:hypothetical protein